MDQNNPELILSNAQIINLAEITKAKLAEKIGLSVNDMNTDIETHPDLAIALGRGVEAELIRNFHKAAKAERPYERKVWVIEVPSLKSYIRDIPIGSGLVKDAREAIHFPTQSAAEEVLDRFYKTSFWIYPSRETTVFNLDRDCYAVTGIVFMDYDPFLTTIIPAAREANEITSRAEAYIRAQVLVECATVCKAIMDHDNSPGAEACYQSILSLARGHIKIFNLKMPTTVKSSVG